LHQQQQQQQQQQPHRLISGKFIGGKKGKSWKSRDDELHSMDDFAFEVQRMHSKILHSSSLIDAIQRHSSSTSSSSSSSRNLFIESDDDNDDELRSDNGDEVLTDFNNSGLRFTPLKYNYNYNYNNNNNASSSGVRAKSSTSKTSSYFTSFKVADIFGWVPLVAIRRFVRCQKRDIQTYQKNAIVAKEELNVLTETNAHLTAAIDALTAKERVSPQSVIKLVNQHLACREANKEAYEPYTPTTLSPKSPTGSGFLARRLKGGGVLGK